MFLKVCQVPHSSSLGKLSMKSLSLGIVRASASSALAYSRLWSESPTQPRSSARGGGML
ncbi:MAG: hypothetical protein LBQ31_09575 [Bacteroidales bacterium]|nr:hypothetical protein [Bacteroidales bacterium]